MAHAVSAENDPSAGVQRWEPEDNAFWESTGKSIANRNLWISVPCLLCAFAVWSYWSIITVQMKNLEFPFTASQLFTLTAVAGLTGATLRIPNAFLIAIAGGRNVIVVSTALLLIPSIGAGIALQDKSTPYETFVILAALSGFGGGNFASSMSNISFFFPKRMQGTALGINAGLGNLGVSVMQVFLPFAMTMSIFGALGGAGMPLPEAIGGRAAGSLVWIQNCGLVWVPVLSVLVLAAWFGMNNLPMHYSGPAVVAFLKILGLKLMGLLGAAAGLYLLLGLGWSMWIALPITIVLTLLLMKLIPGEVAVGLKKQFSIFNEKHNWIMTWLYIMTFGSFIGFSMAFPLLIRVVFGTLADGSTPNPDAPNPFTYAWLGPLVGSLIRPVGGWLSDKWDRRQGDAAFDRRHDLGDLGRCLLREGRERFRYATGLLLPVLVPVPASVPDERNREWIDVPHDRCDFRTGAGGPRSGMVVRGSRVRSVPDPENLRTTDRSGPARVCALWIRRLLLQLPDRELVVLRAKERGDCVLIEGVT